MAASPSPSPPPPPPPATTTAGAAEAGIDGDDHDDGEGQGEGQGAGPSSSGIVQQQQPQPQAATDGGKEQPSKAAAAAVVATTSDDAPLGDGDKTAAPASPSASESETPPTAPAPPPLPLLVLSHPACLLHNLPGHVERPQRVTAMLEALKASRLLPAHALELDGDAAAPRVTRRALERFHGAKHVDKLFTLFQQAAALQAAGKRAVRDIDADTAVMPATEEAALRAAGATCVAVDRVLTGQAAAAFAVVRPPGHHATPTKAMGFCVFNNAGVAALHARAEHGVERVACVDIDVHHGNGTQDFFENDPKLFYASTHMGHGQYPGTGFEDETGVADNIVNVPLREGEGSKPFREAYETRILPALAAFRPELLLISAGFDAHGDDPLGELELTAEDFHWVTTRLVETARGAAECRGVVSVLEGGYNLSALADCAVAHARGLLGLPFSLEPEPAPPATPAPAAAETAAAAAAVAEAAAEAREEAEVIAGLARLATGDGDGGEREGEGEGKGEGEGEGGGK